ncbi:MAG: cold-shock protein [Candidatus Hodarchaeales archaeon]|jgi:cold shock CspA family protein
MPKGTVKWFNVTKDFVLIEENNSKELLVQRSSIKSKRNKMLTKAKEKVKASQANI